MGLHLFSFTKANSTERVTLTGLPFRWFRLYVYLLLLSSFIMRRGLMVS